MFTREEFLSKMHVEELDELLFRVLRHAFWKEILRG